MQLRDRAFAEVFRRMFVYNILFEDAEVDERYLGIDADSSVLAISGAGCGVAGMLARAPARIDAVDINAHHLRLCALKVAAMRHLDYGTFYDLMGRGWSPDPQRTVDRLSTHLNPPAARYWRRHARRFSRTLYREGLTSRMLTSIRKRVGIDARWILELAQLPEVERVQRLDALLRPLAQNPAAVVALSSPLQQLALGINFTQRDRLLAAEGQDMVAFFCSHLARTLATDLHTNWFVWYAVAGHFNHDRDDAVPPYLRRDRWAAAQHAPTEVAFHHGDLFARLAAAGPGTWSHYTLLDAVDWMPPQVQRRLFSEIRRTARPGAVVLWRSVSDDVAVDALGLQDVFRRVPGTEHAASQDRSRQYRQVNFFRLEA